MIQNLRIDSLAFGGNGVGRHEGKAVFVPYSVPGDLIRCRPVREKKRFVEASMEELLEPSVDRCPPRCPVFGECGGCQWQHLPYQKQSFWKDRIFRDTLTRHAGVAAERILPLVAAPSPWHYRSRVQFKCRQAENGFVMGFYRRGSHFVVDVEQCPIAMPEVNAALALFRHWLPASPHPGRVQQVDVAVDDEGALRAVVHLPDGGDRGMAEYLAPLAGEAGIALFLQVGRKKTLSRVCGENDLHIRPTGPDGLRLAYGPGGFAQINLAQNRALVKHVMDLSGLDGSQRVLDLFCGMGNFSLPMAGLAAEVVGVEDYAPSIDMARHNARCNAIENVRFFARPAEGAARQCQGGGPFDLVVLDPPRSGAFEVVEELKDIAPSRIVYVSCDPSTLARDLAALVQGGFRVASSVPVDLFPQTFHTESVTLLEYAGA